MYLSFSFNGEDGLISGKQKFSSYSDKHKITFNEHN
jgi:hypothetical protein